MTSEARPCRLARAVAVSAVALGIALMAAGPRPLAAQQPGAAQPGRPTRGPQMIEIRGQVPTPQVVTVRPRQMPMFSREVLTPAYFDLHFWDVLLTPYAVAPNLSAEAGVTPISMAAPPLPTDSAYRPPPAVDSAHVVPSAAPAGTPAAAAAPATPTRTPAATRPDTTPPTAPREK
jgi:hypothetical protein